MTQNLIVANDIRSHMGPHDYTGGFMGNAAIKNFEIIMNGNIIELHGDVLNTNDIAEDVTTVLYKAAGQNRPLVIDASDARVFAEAVGLWILAVHECLMKCELTYRPSQLTEMLRYDDDYRHPQSTLQEFYS